MKNMYLRAIGMVTEFYLKWFTVSMIVRLFLLITAGLYLNTFWFVFNICYGVVYAVSLIFTLVLVRSVSPMVTIMVEENRRAEEKGIR